MLALVITCRDQHACGGGRKMLASCLQLWELNFSWREKKQSMGAVLFVGRRRHLSPVDIIFICRASTTAILNVFFSSLDPFPVTYSINVHYPKESSNTFPITYSKNTQYPTKFSNTFPVTYSRNIHYPTKFS